MKLNIRDRQGRFISRQGILVLLLAIVLGWFAFTYPEHYFTRTEVLEKIYEGKPLISPTVTQELDGWSTYKDIDIGFGIRFPSDWFYSRELGSVVITPLAPDDIKRSSDIGVLSSVVIHKISYEDLELINERAASEKNFSFNGVVGRHIVVEDAFTGGSTNHYIFLNKQGENMDISFHNNVDEEKYPFEKIVKTFFLI